ncbi:hypothetical protein [Acinetobacter baumannii]|uniref:hypothetical protein n=1 Tax=Acinetobacter baumannii TaxID=470 RepID=UPI001057B31F|nr:hypothetical protein [Acinetobacter baumannii]QBM33835.1 hypothetical protein E1A89_09730 [Acinetobacter baumannii]QBM44610.1 hypothetical protein E1A87_11225 [Acinetobacter baumannii]
MKMTFKFEKIVDPETCKHNFVPAQHGFRQSGITISVFKCSYCHKEIQLENLREIPEPCKHKFSMKRIVISREDRESAFMTCENCREIDFRNPVVVTKSFLHKYEHI